MRIRIITPITTPGVTSPEDFAGIVDESVVLEQVSIEQGPASLEARFEDALAVPEVLRCSLDAAREGVDALVIDCLGDPGLQDARELLGIPVIGPGEASFRFMPSLAHNFSIVTVLARLAPFLQEEARKYGVDRQLCSVRGIETTVLELHAHNNGILDAMAEEAVKAVECDRAAAILLGCTGMKGLGPGLRSRLSSAGHPDIPVVDPMPVAIKMAEMMVTLRLLHSRMTYPSPSEKKIVGYEHLVESLRLMRLAGASGTDALDDR
jgi:allantoin racemase